MLRTVILGAVLILILALAGCDFTTTVVQQSTPTPTSTLSISPSPVTAILNSVTAQQTYHGQLPVSPDDAFVVTDVSFANRSSTSQTLQPSWDLKDTSGNHFLPVDPPPVIVLDPGESSHQTTAFEVPLGEQCNALTLYLINVGPIQSWPLSC